MSIAISIYQHVRTQHTHDRSPLPCRCAVRAVSGAIAKQVAQLSTAVIMIGGISASAAASTALPSKSPEVLKVAVCFFSLALTLWSSSHSIHDTPVPLFIDSLYYATGSSS